jgi:hypothetical protein
VLEAMTFGAPRRERQDGIEAIQGLNGGLLIDAEYGRVLRRAQIEAEDVGGLAFEFRIVAGQVAFETVRFQARFLPNAMHSVFADVMQEWAIPNIHNYFPRGAKPCSLCLLILSTIPALRSATSLTLYSAEEPITCATSEGVSL